MLPCTSFLLMIEPVNFGFNEETAVNNAFQENLQENIQPKALEEFNELVLLLQANKVNVTVVKDTLNPFTPDSIFPNNWISFHENGTVILYPMFADNRRLERKTSVLNAIEKKFLVRELIDLSQAEEKQLYLEGTGSMVLDRENGIAYACLSPRTHEQLLNEFCRLNEYTPFMFSASDSKGIPIYHTNVMMSIATGYVVICLEAITNITERDTVVACLNRSGKIVIDISFDQLHHFAGNMLQVKNTEGELLLVMSTRAYDSLTTEQLNTLQRFNRILHSSLATIETVGGGSARCMIAEVFLKPG